MEPNATARPRSQAKRWMGWVDLSDASRQDLQATLKSLEGSETECVGGSASSLGVRGTHTAGQGCYLPVRPSSRPDLKNPDGHWKGGEYCEEPQRAGVAGRRKHSRKRKTICGSFRADSSR